MSWKIKSNYSCNWLVEYISTGLSKNVKYTVQIIKTSRGAIDLSKAVLREGGEGGAFKKYVRRGGGRGILKKRTRTNREEGVVKPVCRCL